MHRLSPPPRSPAEAAHATSVELLEQGTYGRALAAAAAAAKLPGGDALEAGLATLRLVCRLHLTGPATSCWQVLRWSCMLCLPQCPPAAAVVVSVARASRWGLAAAHARPI